MHVAHVSWVVLDNALCTATAGARLVGGSSTSAGILELWYNGNWRTVCKESMDTREATLICRQLGFLPVGETVLAIANFQCNYSCPCNIS